MALPTHPPTDEIGNASLEATVPSWGQLQTFIDSDEKSPDLIWPNSVSVYEQMRNDAQVEGLLAGTILPLLRYSWVIDPNGAKDEIVEKISRDYGIPIQGEQEQFRPRKRNRFNFKRHQIDAFRALTFGHYYFEQVGEIGDDGKWHVKKLAPRRPASITEINVAKDGGLEGIKQTLGPQVKPIPVSQLVAYVWDQEGGNWVGRSMLRALYRNWVIKDVLIRVDAIKNERAGAGTPIGKGAQDASDEELEALNELAQAFRSGENAGGALPFGTELDLLGIRGTLPDTIGSINYHDEQMARRFLMMFVQLGSTQTGSRALGESFVDFFGFAQQFIAEWFCEVFNEHVIEDDVDWNYENEELVPLLTFDRSVEEGLPTSDLVMLVDKGIITVDPELESFIRQSKNLPPLSDDAPEPTPPSPEAPGGGTQAGGGRRRKGVAADAEPPSPLSLPARDLRRQPYDHEVAAEVDFARLEDQWVSRKEELFSVVRELQRAQVDELHGLIIEANGDLVKLGELSVAGNAESEIFDGLKSMAEEGIDQALDEAKAQGVVSAARGDVADLEDAMGRRAQAMDGVLTRELSGAAAQKAMSLTGGSLTPQEVADETKAYMEALKAVRVEKQLGGALTNAQNAGRKSTMVANDPAEIYASELLDTNTCTKCVSVDGTEYAKMAQAEMDYPGGGYMECEGGDSCRGTLVAVYE